MTDVTDYIRYFQKIANEHVDINDFYIMDINEPLAALRSDIRYPALVLNSLAGILRVPNADNTLDELQGGFMVLDHLENVDDFHTEMEVLQSTKRICADIIARMIQDVKTHQSSISGFNTNSVTYEMLGPIFDNDFGFQFNFKVHSGIDLQYDSTKWDPERILGNKTAY